MTGATKPGVAAMGARAMRVCARPAAVGISALLATVVLLAGASDARAQFKVCNQTFDLYNLSIGYGDARKFKTEGWWTVPANSCVSPIRDDLQSRYIYLYVANIYGEPVLSGSSVMCVGREKFSAGRKPDQPWECWLRGLREAKFVEIDTGNSTEWITFIKDKK